MTYSIDIIDQFIEYASKNNNLSLYSSTSNISKKYFFKKVLSKKFIMII